MINLNVSSSISSPVSVMIVGGGGGGGGGVVQSTKRTVHLKTQFMVGQFAGMLMLLQEQTNTADHV